MRRPGLLLRDLTEYVDSEPLSKGTHPEETRKMGVELSLFEEHLNQFLLDWHRLHQIRLVRRSEKKS